MIGGLFVVVFFLPLSFIYGRWRARGLKAAHATLKGRLLALMPMPLFFAVCFAVATVWQSEAAQRRMADLAGSEAESALDTGNGVLDGVLTIARWLGQVELILFMVALPYLLGALVACGLLILDANGRIVLAPPEPPAVDPQAGEG
ncbi:hypothetical protein U0C82_10980 [Fulvimarina sp. 2208YS6-2-32]|uniref:Uncharacterized protein n=1 Tax=Fulvimarina uroteuthidis TaxID=3098149 RepID=A0ABU5I347_9HYPH|nr:hypothetical protein [Fulvimarina sp. 2208YS6-2-32]MDY8109661.1 hypothetical protein [Fulvimarina sp. 2208YS6-2-32]